MCNNVFLFVVSKGWRKGGLGSHCFLGAGSGWDDEKALDTEVAVAQCCEYTQHHVTLYLNMAEWMHLSLYLTTFFFLKKDQKVTKQSLVIDF